jgi:hypothetical protein
MMKKLIIGLGVLAIALLVGAPAGAVQNDAIQANDINNRLTMAPGEWSWIYYDFTNWGTVLPPAGTSQVPRVGTSEPRDRSSAFYISPSDDVLGDAGAGLAWTSSNRLRDINATAAGGINVSTIMYFATPSTLPSSLQLGKTYREYLEFVLDNGGSWLPTSKGYVDITVDTKHGKWVGQSAYPTIARGSSAEYTIQFKNTGPTGWYRNGQRGYTSAAQVPVSAVRLGTANPLDRGSLFWATGTTGWVSNNRIRLLESYVAPGDIGTFVFRLTPHVTLSAGTYYEKFQLVCEGIGWMEDDAVTVPITVN